MSWSILGLVFFSIILSALAQILMRIGMSSGVVREKLSEGSIGSIALVIATEPHVLGGLFAYALSAIFWLFVLSRIEVSLAYPFVALGLVLVVLTSALFLGEQVTLVRLIGLLFIVTGVVLVGRSVS